VKVVSGVPGELGGVIDCGVPLERTSDGVDELALPGESERSDMRDGLCTNCRTCGLGLLIGTATGLRLMVLPVAADSDATCSAANALMRCSYTDFGLPAAKKLVAAASQMTTSSWVLEYDVLRVQ
jgi:hypothetical protein